MFSKLDGLTFEDAITFRIKINLFFMFKKITTLISFKIESTFKEWVKITDSKKEELRHSEFFIKPLFKGLKIDDHKKVICIDQAKVGNLQKFVRANSESIQRHKFDFSTMEKSS